MQAASPEYHREYPNTDGSPHFTVGPLRDSIIGDARNSLLMMLGAVALVLLIACANVANLLLVRATVRKREFAIRSALGAGRARIVRQLLTESVLLSLAGGILGMVLGVCGMRALLAVSPAGLPRIGEDGSAISIDWRVLGFTLAVSLLTGILFGLFPAFSASRSDLNSALKESGNRSGTGFREGKARSLLVISEISLALVLLIGSALLIRTFIALRDGRSGFDAHNVADHGDVAQRPALPEDGRRERSSCGMAATGSMPSPEWSIAAAAYWLPIDVEDAHVVPDRRASGQEGLLRRSKWMSISPGYLSLFRDSRSARTRLH